MALVVVKYLGNDTRNGINQVEEWYLPSDAFVTKFFDDQGRRLHLVGTREQILAEDAFLAKNPVVNYHGQDFVYAGPAPVAPPVAPPVVVPPVVVPPVVEVPVVEAPVVEVPVTVAVDPTVTP